MNARNIFLPMQYITSHTIYKPPDILIDPLSHTLVSGGAHILYAFSRLPLDARQGGSRFSLTLKFSCHEKASHSQVNVG